MTDERMRITIGHLYPDLLNLYGDHGNTIALTKRCEWRDIDAQVVDLGAGQDADFEDIDLFFIGGGQDFDQRTLLADLGVGVAGSKASRLQRPSRTMSPYSPYVAVTRFSASIMSITKATRLPISGALPMYTEAGDTRLIGNIVFTADAIEGAPVVVGFENHAGRTHLREGARALGTVVKGFGNNGEDGTEGLRYRNVIATYSHGPLLPKNPRVADALIELALQRRYPGVQLSRLDDALEDAAHDTMKQRLIS